MSLLVLSGAGPGRAASALDGPPPPDPPLTISRDAAGRATLRAVRLSEPLRLDGALQEPVYRSVPAAGGFIQQEPHEGAPASEPTEVWVFFDDESLYVSARCYDSQPGRMVANELRRDHFNVFENENFGVVLDTFYDRRNGFFFYTNPLGALSDQTVTDERDSNRDWNTVWDVRTGRFEHGWTVEMAIPFKSLRYGSSPYWGINFRRRVRWKNEMSYLTLVPASAGRRGMLKLSSAGTLVGLEPPRTSLSLELKPYLTAGLQTDREAEPGYDNAREAQAGLDLKYGITKSLTLDVTVNTDFAQVEDDEQQVNLSRFSLLLPEKRDFFLEGQGLFGFGNAETRTAIPSRTPILFFSRRIGLVEDTEEAIPILAGGRLTGKAGAFGIGALHLRTDAADSGVQPRTDFSVVRVKRDILRRSTIGVIATRRAPSELAGGSNESYGADASFGFGESLLLSGYYALTRTPGLSGRDASWNARLDYSGDRYGLQAERLVVGENFKPEIGFVPREDIRRSFAQARFSPRPASIESIRKLAWEASYDAYENGRGQLESRELGADFRVDFENSDELRVSYRHSYESLDEPFELTDAAAIPAGTYEWHAVEAGYELGRQRRLSGEIQAGYGGFYSGTRAEAGFHGRLELSPQLSVEPRLGFNWIDLAESRFATTLLGLRVNAALTPRVFLGALVQYSSEGDSLGSNLRFRWEYRPGSEIFLVYSDGWDTSRPGRTLLRHRSLVLKLTRLVRF